MKPEQNGNKLQVELDTKHIKLVDLKQDRKTGMLPTLALELGNDEKRDKPGKTPPTLK